ncbi:DUF4259 domain-containing protein [Streptomyces sp. NPDC020845]|uniref:DUF4259 domain-containing protein n=1 Tax=Streptomyces sp. NPDC020845 TaxID=3365096 RepID=UPI00379F3D49
MGTWDVGPFDNDEAADFAYTLDETVPDKREELVRATLNRAVQIPDYLESHQGQEAVGAAALIAAQCPGGEQISTSYGPEEALPPFADDLQPLAVEALDRVVAEDSELAELWRDAPDGPKWRQSISLLRAILAPNSGPQKEALFDL